MKVAGESLLRPLTRANLEGFYHRPRIDYDAMLDIDLSGLIIMTACAGSFLHLEGGPEFLLTLIREKDVECYLEIMPHNIPAQEKQHQLLDDLLDSFVNEEREPQYVATNDCLVKDTLILTNKGHKPIQDISINDLVLTHKNRFRKVTRIFKRNYKKGWTKLKLINDKAKSIMATDEHPLLVFRDKKLIWVKISEVRKTDKLMVKSSNCEVCGNIIPAWMRLCKYCNPAELEETKKKLKEYGRTRKLIKNQKVLIAT